MPITLTLTLSFILSIHSSFSLIGNSYHRSPESGYVGSGRQDCLVHHGSDSWHSYPALERFRCVTVCVSFGVWSAWKNWKKYLLVCQICHPSVFLRPHSGMDREQPKEENHQCSSWRVWARLHPGCGGWPQSKHVISVMFRKAQIMFFWLMYPMHSCMCARQLYVSFARLQRKSVTPSWWRLQKEAEAKASVKSTVLTISQISSDRYVQTPSKSSIYFETSCRM